MSKSPAASSEPADPREYLVVDQFIRDLVGARALKIAMEFGLIGRPSEPGSVECDELERIVGADAPGFAFFLDLLLANGVVEEESGQVRLTDGFRMALWYRDLLGVKLDFMAFVIGDFVHLFDSLITDPSSFQQCARLFKNFDFGRCVEPTPENLEHAKGWVRLTTALTKYEWVYLFAAVNPVTGESSALRSPTVDTDLMNAHLQMISKQVRGPGGGRHVVLVLDQAGWHVAKALNACGTAHFPKPSLHAFLGDLCASARE